MNTKQDGQEAEKLRLEQSIIELSRELNRDYQSGCYNSEKLQDFTYLWYALAQYYENFEDYSISVELIGIYLDFTHIFAVVHNDEKSIPECREQAYEALIELTSRLNDIITTVEERSLPSD